MHSAEGLEYFLNHGNSANNYASLGQSPFKETFHQRQIADHLMTPRAYSWLSETVLAYQPTCLGPYEHPMCREDPT